MRDTSSKPIFAEIPGTVEERMQSVAEFALRWSGDRVVPPPGMATRVRAAETRLGTSLPLTLQRFYESGLHEWFVSHGRGSGPCWAAVEELTIHERTGALTIVEGWSRLSIRPEDLSESDPPIYEFRIMGPYFDPPFEVIRSVSAVPMSEMLIREVLMAVSNVVPNRLHRLPLEEGGPDEQGDEAVRQQLRKELPVVPINGLKNGDQWRFYEGADLLYQETDPNVEQESPLYALLVGRTSEAIVDLILRTFLT